MAPFRPFLGNLAKIQPQIQPLLSYAAEESTTWEHCLQAAQRTDHREFVLFEPGKSEQTGSSGAEVPINFLKCFLLF